MKYAVHVDQQVLRITLEGTFTFIDARMFHKLLAGIERCSDPTEIRIDIKHLDYVDAAALNMLLMAHDTAKKFHHSLAFEGAYGQVSDALINAARFNDLTLAA